MPEVALNGYLLSTQRNTSASTYLSTLHTRTTGFPVSEIAQALASTAAVSFPDAAPQNTRPCGWLHGSVWATRQASTNSPALSGEEDTGRTPCCGSGSTQEPVSTLPITGRVVASIKRPPSLPSRLAASSPFPCGEGFHRQIAQHRRNRGSLVHPPGPRLK